MRFLLFDPPILATQAIAATIVAALLAIALYWRGEHRVSGRTKVALTCLRTAALVVIGFLLLNPIVIRSAAGGEGKSRFIVLLDDSRSMGVRDANGWSRFDAAKQAALGNERLLSDLESLYDMSFYAFSVKAERSAVEPLRASKHPVGERTELGDALMTVASEASRRGERTAGALLLSDGRDNGSVPPLAAAKVARSAELPIWTLCFGTESPAKDATVLTYTSQNFAFARQRTTLSADVQQTGYGATTLAVGLERNGQPVVNQTVPFTGDGRRTVRFPVTEPNPGLYKYTIAVRPLPAEINTRNNARSVFLRVINEKVKVLLLDARPSWDTKFLGQALRQDPNIELTGIYRLTKSRDFSVTAGAPQSATRTTQLKPRNIRLPRRPEELFPYDVVILGKGFEDLLAEAGVDMLKKYLLERGGSVVFCRGKPDEGTDKLRDLEPVVWSGDEVHDLQLTLTEEGRENPAFSFPTPEEPQTILRKLPHLLSATRVKGEKSFAVILARATGAGTLSGPGKRPEEPMALVAYQRYGAGRVLVITGQGLWQWAFLPDELAKYDTVYRSFWAQMLRWLVSGSDFLPGQDVSLKTDRLSYVPGQQVHLLVFVKQAPLEKVAPKLEVLQPDGRHVAITPSRGEAFGATFTGVYTPNGTGDYSVTLRTGPRESDKLEAAFTVYESQQEDILTAADPQLMRQIAEASGGGVVTRDDLRNLPRLVQAVERRTLLREQPVSLWDRPWVFVLLCALLSTEWYLRRRRGLC